MTQRRHNLISRSTGLLVALACGLLLSSMGAASNLILAGQDEQAAQVLPIWNTHSGRVEALLLLAPDEADISLLDGILPRKSAPGLGLGLRLDGGSQLRSSLQPDVNTGLALLCSQGVHVAMALGPLREQCLLAEVGASGDPMLGMSSSPGLRLDAGWQSAGGALNLSFGLAWLDSALREPAGAVANPGWMLATQQPGTHAPLRSAAIGELRLREIHANSRLLFGDGYRFSLAGSLGSHELDTLVGGSQRWDSTAVTLGIGYRGLSGHITGRLIELPSGQGNFSGLDLGFSWRTPWQGELSFGAQNLLNRPTPDTSHWPMAELPVLETPGGRTPYVRYKQDL